MNLYVGIDPGLEGGIVALDGQGVVLHAFVMPTMPSGKGKPILDHLGLRHVFDELRRHVVPLHVILERQQAFPHSRPCPNCKCPVPVGQGGVSTMTTGIGFGALLQEIVELPHEVIGPQVWQKEFGIRGKGTETKKQARVVAQRLWPKALVPEGCRVPHVGLVDAALMAEWGRRKNVGAVVESEVPEEEL